MYKSISIISFTALFGLASCAFIAPALAQTGQRFQQQNQYIGNFCSQNPHARQCGDWKMNHAHWGNSQYQGFYRAHQNDSGFGGNVVAGLFGLAIGTAVGSALENGADSGDGAHIRACQSAYRSYDARTDTYLGYDGARHLCQV